MTKFFSVISVSFLDKALAIILEINFADFLINTTEVNARLC